MSYIKEQKVRKSTRAYFFRNSITRREINEISKRFCKIVLYLLRFLSLNDLSS